MLDFTVMQMSRVNCEKGYCFIILKEIVPTCFFVTQTNPATLEGDPKGWNDGRVEWRNEGRKNPNPKRWNEERRKIPQNPKTRNNGPARGTDENPPKS